MRVLVFTRVTIRKVEGRYVRAIADNRVAAREIQRFRRFLKREAPIDFTAGALQRNDAETLQRDIRGRTRATREMTGVFIARNP